MYKNKWVICNWFNGFDEKYYTEDYIVFEQVSEFQIFECIDEIDEYLYIRNYSRLMNEYKIFKLYKELFKIVPKPKYVQRDMVTLRKNREVEIVGVFWHETEKYHYYTVIMNGKILSGRYYDSSIIQK